VVAERIGTIILSTIIAHTAWHWMTERFDQLRKFQFSWPVINAVFMLWVVRWLIVIMVLAGLLWIVTTLITKTQRHKGTKAREQSSY